MCKIMEACIIKTAWDVWEIIRIKMKWEKSSDDGKMEGWPLASFCATLIWVPIDGAPQGTQYWMEVQLCFGEEM